MVDSGSSRSGGLSPISRYYKTRFNPRLWVAVTAFYGPLSTTRRLLIRARLWLQTEGPRLIRSVRWKKCGFLNLSTSAVESEKPEEPPGCHRFTVLWSWKWQQVRWALLTVALWTAAIRHRDDHCIVQHCRIATNVKTRNCNSVVSKNKMRWIKGRRLKQD